jgi:NADH:ubiquinone oxidoreductase subunit 6 (subunit J)
MDILEILVFLGALMLFFVVSLSILSAFSKVLAQNAAVSEKTRRSREGGCLMFLTFVSMLAILVWRMI